MSVLRPATLLSCRGSTSRISTPRSLRSSKRGIQYTPVDSIATVSILQRVSETLGASFSAAAPPLFVYRRILLGSPRDVHAPQSTADADQFTGSFDRPRTCFHRHSDRA